MAHISDNGLRSFLESIAQNVASLTIWQDCRPRQKRKHALDAVVDDVVFGGVECLWGCCEWAHVASAVHGVCEEWVSCTGGSVVVPVRSRDCELCRRRVGCVGGGQRSLGAYRGGFGRVDLGVTSR